MYNEIVFGWSGWSQFGYRLCWRRWLKRTGGNRNRWLTSIKQSQNHIYITSATVCDLIFSIEKMVMKEGHYEIPLLLSRLFQPLTVAYWLLPTPCCISKTFSLCRPLHDVPLSLFATEHINGFEGRPALSLDETIRWWRQSTTWYSCMMAKRR